MSVNLRDVPEAASYYECSEGQNEVKGCYCSEDVENQTLYGTKHRQPHIGLLQQQQQQYRNISHIDGCPNYRSIQ